MKKLKKFLSLTLLSIILLSTSSPSIAMAKEINTSKASESITENYTNYRKALNNLEKDKDFTKEEKAEIKILMKERYNDINKKNNTKNQILKNYGPFPPREDTNWHYLMNYNYITKKNDYKLANGYVFLKYSAIAFIPSGKLAIIGTIASLAVTLHTIATNVPNSLPGCELKTYKYFRWINSSSYDYEYE
ncbi:hypothetical protein G7A79_25205, partial [Coprococcus sp. MSK.21.13]|nr:hypothetical protein [Coprococcus sp. MSK.21.13]